YEVSLTLPVTLYQGGADPFALGLAPDRARGAGDLRFGGKARIWSNDWFGVGGLLELLFPTGDAGAYLGTGNVSATVRLFAHVHLGRLRLAATAGWRFADEQQLFAVRSGESLLVGGGADLELWKSAARHAALDAAVEVWAQFHYLLDGEE